MLYKFNSESKYNIKSENIIFNTIIKMVRMDVLSDALKKIVNAERCG